MVPVVAGTGDLEDLVGVGVEVGCERAAAVQAEGEPGVLGGHGVPGTRGDGHEVGGDQRGGCGLPAAAAGAPGDGVGEDGPAFGCGDAELEDGFEVGLVERGEHPLDVLHEQLGVDVCLAVGGVGEPVHALAGVRVAHRGVDQQFVLAGRDPGEREPVPGERAGVDGVSVEGHGAQLGGLDFDEGVSGRTRGESDDGTGVEGVVALRQIEVDRVPLDIEELGSELRFIARQYGHGAMVPYATGPAHGVMGTGGRSGGEGESGRDPTFSRCQKPSSHTNCCGEPEPASDQRVHGGRLVWCRRDRELRSVGSDVQGRAVPLKGGVGRFSRQTTSMPLPEGATGGFPCSRRPR